MMKKTTIVDAVFDELEEADCKYPPMAEMMEGLHTLKCEIAELEREVMRANFNKHAMIKEAIQVSAMAIKFLRDCCDLPLHNDVPLEALEMSKRGKEWMLFSNKVLSHIEEYTVPQYGDKGQDRADGYDLDTIAEHIGRYKDRMNSNSRGRIEAKRDMLKIAHYASMAYDIIQE